MMELSAYLDARQPQGPGAMEESLLAGAEQGGAEALRRGVERLLKRALAAAIESQDPATIQRIVRAARTAARYVDLPAVLVDHDLPLDSPLRKLNGYVCCSESSEPDWHRLLAPSRN